MSEDNMIIVKSKIKTLVDDVNIGSDFVGALNDVATALVKKARERCLANGRKTLKPQDL